MKTSKMIISIIASILTLIASQIVSRLLASIFVLIGIPEFFCNIIAGIAYLTLVYYMVKMLCEKYLKDNLSAFFIARFKLEIKWVIVAFLMPVVVSFVYLSFFEGTFILSNVTFIDKMTTLAAGIFFTGISVGFVEEIIFRGVIMNVLSMKYNKKIAILVPSVLFGAVHIIGMDFNILSCLLVLVAGTSVGIMFSLIAYDKKSIWNSAIVHSLWNIIIIGGILCIGTTIDEYSISNYVLNSNSFVLTGGEFGIESSIISVAAYFIVSIIAYLSLIKQRK